MDILGVRIDNFSKKEILEKIETFLSDGHFHQIATVNPEFILQAQKDVEFKDILNAASLNVADGSGIWYACIRFGEYLRVRMAGVDLMQEILRIANDRKLGVFLAINKKGLSTYEEVRRVLEKSYPAVIFNGDDFDLKNRSEFRIPRSMVLFCNFGAPHQEKFINSVKNDIIGLGMGVGGSFDFLTGKACRAPKIMRYFGLEWLWRLIRQPNRFKRIFAAVVIFPIRIIFNK